MKTIEIKILDPENINEIKVLWEKLNTHHLKYSTCFQDHFATFTFNQRVKNLVLREKLKIFLAIRSDVKIGYCIATCDKGNGEIDSIYIKEENRNEGIGQILIAEAMDWLKRQGCKNIRVYIAEGNENAIPFYRKFNFAERFIVMELKK